MAGPRAGHPSRPRLRAEESFGLADARPMGGRVKPGHDGGGKKKSAGGYRRRGSPVFSLHGRPIEDRLSGQPQSTFASTSPVSMRSTECCPGASGAGLPLSARGARKLAPLPVCSCGESRSAMAFSLGIYGRTYSEHDVGLSSPIQEELYDKLSEFGATSYFTVHKPRTMLAKVPGGTISASPPELAER